ncbi:hypothetical protein SAMN05446037_1004151 [Anaerovirgula multivorans]|uniref:Uncharacterized protein n=1 Tax=Anaerovirgula multivorans TaxID=312168 RepID=A0A239BX71_9FIRM|nr:hypothetical protein [Anaerovirgula multivorans]SNS11664.1 hypothetical protein SAMN05446037_1004151 [Anaerovirgula multivorans]
MLSMQTVNDLLAVVNNLDTTIEENKDIIDLKEVQYLTYQKIKILQLIDDLHHKESYFNHTKE